MSAIEAGVLDDRGAGPGSGFQLVTETKFMRQYRTASAAHGRGGIVAVKNAAGRIEIFTTGTDGTVWNFYPDPASSTGFRAISTGLGVSTGTSPPIIAAGLNAVGNLVVFAVKDLTLNYSIQQDLGQGRGRWAAVKQADLSAPPDAKEISTVLCCNIDRALITGVLFKTFQSSSYYWPFWYATGGLAPQKFIRSDFVAQRPGCVWTNNTLSTIEFTNLDAACVGYLVQKNTIVIHGKAIKRPEFLWPISLSSQPDGTANRYFTVMNDGNIYEYSSGWPGYEWRGVTTGASFAEVTSARDSAGAIHLIGLGKDNRLWHIAPAENGTWIEPVPLAKDVGRMAACTDGSGAIELYLLGATRDTLTRVVRDDKTGDWRNEPIELPDPGSKHVEPFVAYATDITVCNANGTPQPNTMVEVSASSVVQIAANGSMYSVGPQAPVHLATNHAGTLAIAQPTESLGVPTLSFSLASQQPIAVRQFAGVEHDLATLTTTKLLEARDESGEYILSEQYHNSSAAKALADSCRACMQLVQSTAVRLDAAGLKGAARKLGVGTHSREATQHLNRIIASSVRAHWLIEFGEGTVNYRELTEAAARSELDSVVASHRPVPLEGPLSTLRELGDLITAVSNGVAKVTKAVVTVFDNKVKAALTFVIEGVNWIIESIVSVAEEAFDLVEVVFANIQVNFEKTFEWLGFIFNWDDILRTRTVIAHAIEEFLGFLPLAAAGIKSRVDGRIANVIAQVDAVFNGFVTQLGGGNLGGAFRDNHKDDPRFSSAIANNQILDATVSSGGAGSIRMSAVTMRALSGPLDGVLRTIEDFVANIGDKDEFKQAKEKFKNLGGDLDQILQGMAEAMLRIIQGLTKLMLEGVQTVVDALLDNLSALVTKILELLKATCTVPFVSDFYKWLTDADLTPLDLVALIAAIPTTVLYKAVHGSAPFPDDPSVGQFKTSYTRQILLTRSGLGTNPAIPAVALADASAPQLQRFADIASATCNLGYGLMTIVPDAAAATDGTGGVATGAVAVCSVLGFALELAGQGFGFPWLTSTDPADCSSSDGVKKWLWLHGCTGVALDALFVLSDATFPENNNTVEGPGVALLYGVTRAMAVGQAWEYLTTYGKISGAVEAGIICVKILRLPGVGTRPVLVALGAADLAATLAIGVCTFLDGAPATAEALDVGIRTLPGSVPWAAA